MIELMFRFLGEHVLIVIQDGSVYFGKEGTMMFSTIEGLKLDYTGTLMEFPDLEGRDDWKEEAIRRFKHKISIMKNEDEIATYLINDLKVHGYTPMLKRKGGYRAEKLT